MTARYCDRAGGVVGINEHVVGGGLGDLVVSTCDERLHVKGDGMLPVDDLYGVPYVRPCACADRCNRVLAVETVG